MWKKFENRTICGKVAGKNVVSSFIYVTQCSSRGEYWRCECTVQPWLGLLSWWWAVSTSVQLPSAATWRHVRHRPSVSTAVWSRRWILWRNWRQWLYADIILTQPTRHAVDLYNNCIRYSTAGFRCLRFVISYTTHHNRHSHTRVGHELGASTDWIGLRRMDDVILCYRWTKQAK